MFTCSVIIPAKGRQDLLERAIDSILTSNGSEKCEILVVDDCSSPPLAPRNLRKQDRIIRLDKPSGAAVARNTGIRQSEGDIVYLLDSDDYFIEKDFSLDAKQCSENHIYYSEIFSQGFKSDYPQQVSEKEFLDFVFFRNPHICQTSSLHFKKSKITLFDESLPKHQDWDFVYFALLNGMKVKKGLGAIYFDRSDKSSLSRVPASEKSIPWLNKLTTHPLSKAAINKTQVRFHLLSQYPSRYSWTSFALDSVRLLFRRRTSLKSAVIKSAHRFISAANSLRPKAS